MMKKERFTTIWNRHTFTLSGCAAEAGVGESVILAMLEGVAVAEGIATHVLATFATLTGKPYTLGNGEIAQFAKQPHLKPGEWDPLSQPLIPHRVGNQH